MILPVQSTAVHELNQKLVQAYRQMAAERETAHWLQRSLLPRSLPNIAGVQVAIAHRPSGQPGGDCYDVFALDEHRIGFYIADTMGQGLAASLLAIFLKHSVRRESDDGRLLPNEVLQRVNNELLKQPATETFLTMILGVFDCRNGKLAFSRAGHPHPLVVPAIGEVATWPSTGSLLGIYATDFPLHQRQLGPGDRLLLYTDGLETVADGAPPVIERLKAAACRHRSLGVADHVNQIANELLGAEMPNDDFTLLAIERGSQAV